MFAFSKALRKGLSQLMGPQNIASPKISKLIMFTPHRIFRYAVLFNKRVRLPYRVIGSSGSIREVPGSRLIGWLSLLRISVALLIPFIQVPV
jgi:hypothetical protein